MCSHLHDQAFTLKSSIQDTGSLFLEMQADKTILTSEETSVPCGSGISTQGTKAENGCCSLVGFALLCLWNVQTYTSRLVGYSKRLFSIKKNLNYADIRTLGRQLL
jgi:hypothetical protein